MRIAYIGIKGLPARGGAERVVEAIIRRMVHRHIVTIYCSRRHTPAEIALSGVQLIRIPSLNGKFTHMTSVDFLAALHAVIWGDYDLIHLHHIEASFILPILKTKYKVVSTAHGRFTPGNKWGKLSSFLINLMEIPYALLSDAITNVSLHDSNSIQNMFKRDSIYIPNGVDSLADSDLNASRSILDSNHLLPKKYLLFSAGRIIPLKGVHLLIEAYQGLDLEYPLVIVGDGSHAPDYYMKLKKSANHRVLFIPFISSQMELMYVMRNCYVFVFPSLSEAMSMMLLEAASAGAPILCSDIHANRVVLQNNALFFTSGDVHDLSQKLRWAVENPQDLLRMGQEGRDWVTNNFSWDSIAERYEEIYKKVIGRN